MKLEVLLIVSIIFVSLNSMYLIHAQNEQTLEIEPEI